MKVNKLEAHDRLLYFKKDQMQTIADGVNECMKKNPYSLALQDNSPYIYIFAHPRTDDDGVTKRMLWQARLTKPKAQTNSYLFRAKSHSDIVEICWLLPPREMWAQYEKGKLTENETIIFSIDMFQNHREELERPDPQDLPDERIREILIRTMNEFKKRKSNTLSWEAN
jgi:hypothetical protein